MRSKLIALGLLLAALLSMTASAQETTRKPLLQEYALASTPPSDSSAAPDKGDSENRKEKNDLVSTTSRKVFSFDLSRIDESVVKEFHQAWRCAGGGTNNSEGMVLIFRKVDGSYMARAGECINEYLKFSFKWHPAAIAIVHTHPFNRDPRPTRNDEEIADKFRVPIFTITNSGMFMYDPVTKKTSKVMDKLDWLEASAYAER